MPVVRCGVLALLLLSTTLSAQVPTAAVEQQALDSLLVHVARTRERADLPPPESCRGAGRPLQRLCDGVLTAWRSAWGFGVAARPIRESHLNANPDYNLHRRTPQKDPLVVEARSRFALVVTERPDWAPGWWALALLQLDTEERPDSALRLLTKARALPGLPPGVVDLALARAHYRRGDAAAGWAALLTAVSDTTVLSQRLLTIMLGHYLPAEVVAGWEAAPLTWRGAWLGRTPGVQDLLAGVFSLTGTRVHARGYGLQRTDGAGTGVLPFAFARADLEPEVVDGRRVYRLRVHVTARREGDGLVVVHDTLRVLVDTAPPPRPRVFRYNPRTGEHVEMGSMRGQPADPEMLRAAMRTAPEDVWLGGVVTVPLPPGRWVATLTLTQDGEERGATRLLPPLEVPSGRPETLTISDLVVSGVNRGVVWWSGREEVPLNPMGTWPMSGTVALYAQVSGLTVGDPYRARVRVLREVGDSLEDQMTVGFVEEAYEPTTVWRRTVQMTDWAAGWYRLVVALEQGGVTVTRSERLQVCAAVFLPVCWPLKR